jgi:uncharacterized protein YjbI with pentapeptide repeats
MSNLVVDQQLSLRWKEDTAALSEETRLVRSIAQARTIVIISGLEKGRKRDPLVLIYELGLIDKSRPLVSLKKADFGEADLREITLQQASLSEADLRRTNLTGANLKCSDLSNTDLRGADLSDADLSEVCFAGANLLPYDTEHPARLNAAHLANGVDMTAINLSNDHLVPTKLSGSIVRGADFSGAYLTGVVGLTEQELERQAHSLKGATMPNGQKYEDWVKDKEGRREEE